MSSTGAAGKFSQRPAATKINFPIERSSDVERDCPNCKAKSIYQENELRYEGGGRHGRSQPSLFFSISACTLDICNEETSTCPDTFSRRAWRNEWSLRECSGTAGFLASWKRITRSGRSYFCLKCQHSLQ